jgi:hypothetical protein
VDADTSTVLDADTHAAAAAAAAAATDITWVASDNYDSATDIDVADADISTAVDVDAHADANDTTDIT